MGELVTVPRPEPLWDTDLFWPPQMAPLGNGGAFPVNGQGRFAGTTVANVWNANSGGATRNLQVYQNALCGAFTQGGGAYSDGAAIGMAGFPYLLQGGLAGSYKVPEWRRVYIWEFVLAWNVDAANTIASGLVLSPSDGAVGGWPSLGSKGVGLFRNGVGVWEYRAKTAVGVGVYAEIVPLVWPVALTTLATVQFIIISASGGGDATFQLRVNGLNMLGAAGRSWGSGLLPLFNDGVPPLNAGCFIPFARGGDTVVGGILYIAQVRYRAGKYDPDGNEV